MPRAGSPPHRKRKEPILDHLIAESISRGYQDLVYTGIETHERALEIKRALIRAGKHVPDGKGHRSTTVWAEIEKTPEGYQVHFHTSAKVDAYAYMFRKYGKDRTKWPYSPWGHDPNFDTEIFKEQ